MKYEKKMHMKTHEPVEMICHLCSRVYKTRHSYWSHMSVTHMDDEKKTRHKCDECDKGFPYKDQLNRHKVIHSDVKNYSCSFCGKKFKSNTCVNTHEKIHQGVKPYKCNYCAKAFLKLDKVRKHELIHTGAMDFTCSKCEKKFNQKINQQTHEKKCIGHDM